MHPLDAPYDSHIVCRGSAHPPAPSGRVRVRDAAGFLPAVGAVQAEWWMAGRLGRVPEWPKGTGCKPVGVSLRRFKSFRAQ